MLLAPSGPVSGGGAAFIDRLHADLGGEPIEPLHVTVDRVATADAATLIRAVGETAHRLRPAPVRVDRLYFLPSQARGPEIVKLEVAPDAVLDEDVNELLAALVFVETQPETDGKQQQRKDNEEAKSDDQAHDCPISTMVWKSDAGSSIPDDRSFS